MVWPTSEELQFKIYSVDSLLVVYVLVLYLYASGVEAEWTCCLFVREVVVVTGDRIAFASTSQPT